jgi:hypothetical protein
VDGSSLMKEGVCLIHLFLYFKINIGFYEIRTIKTGKSTMLSGIRCIEAYYQGVSAASG